MFHLIFNVIQKMTSMKDKRLQSQLEKQQSNTVILINIKVEKFPFFLLRLEQERPLVEERLVSSLTWIHHAECLLQYLEDYL